MIDTLAGAFGSAAILSGLALATIGLYGMLRHPDIFEQLHAAGLVTGPALILILLASLASGSAEVITSAILVMAFVLVTASLSTHVIALTAWRQREASGRRVGIGIGEATANDGSTPSPPMRLLLAYDGSPDSDIALALATSIPWPGGSMVTVVGVTEGDMPALNDTEGASGSSDREPDQVLSAAARALQRPGLTVDRVRRGGDPATAILDEAEALDADLVILGSRGRGRLRSLLTGSVAAGVLDRAPCPVLVARTPRFNKVLLATDGSDASAGATDAVARWAIFDGIGIQVLSVATIAPEYRELPPTRTWREATGTSRHRKIAETTAARLQESGRRAAPHVRVGDGATWIVDFAEARSVDLIVLGSRGRTGLTRTLLGSVAHDVLASTQASVLVVRSLP